MSQIQLRQEMGDVAKACLRRIDVLPVSRGSKYLTLLQCEYRILGGKLAKILLGKNRGYGFVKRLTIGLFFAG